MISPTQQQLSVVDRVADRRIHRRIPIELLRVTAVLQPATDSVAAVPGRLTNLSAGGCCLVASIWAVGHLAEGTRCIMSFPVQKQGLHCPGTVVCIEPEPGEGDELMVRVRFRKSDPLTQQKLTRWLGELAVQAWHS